MHRIMFQCNKYTIDTYFYMICFCFLKVITSIADNLSDLHHSRIPEKERKRMFVGGAAGGFCMQQINLRDTVEKSNKGNNKDIAEEIGQLKST